MELGSDRRIQVKLSTGAVGWISFMTKKKEPLIKRTGTDAGQDGELTRSAPSAVLEGFKIGEMLEIRSTVTMRQGEALDTPLVRELLPKTEVKLLALSPMNRRRANILVS